MGRRFFAELWLLLAMPLAAVSQGAAVQVPHANVIPYDDEDAIARLSYRDSPYFMELSGSWKQRQTDSSVIYTRQLDVGKAWKDYDVRLMVRGGRAVRVLLNGKETGYAEDSRHWNEFVLGGTLKYGRANTIAIETLKHPIGALLEDTTIGVGLNGEPYIVFKSRTTIADIDIGTDYDSKTGTGTLSLGVRVGCEKRKGKYYVEAELWNSKGRQHDRMGRWVVFEGRSEESVEMVRSWNDVEVWTAETPQLYTVVIRLRNEKMEEEELVGAKVGFRRVEIKDGVLQVCGKPVTLNGVAYGKEHTEGYASREAMRRDVEAMKAANINAVHTTRYSPMDEYFYELCDRYGLYVVCDANLQPLSTQRRAVATERDFVPQFERRVENMYGSLKNHISIVAWSLGNTRDNGVCMAAAYRRLKALDKSRPVLFSGAGFGENTDIVGLSAPTVREVRQVAGKTQERPVLLMRVADTGNIGELQEKWRLVENGRSLQGGFIDIWPLQGTLQREVRHLYRPFDVSVSKLTPGEGEFRVRNRNVHSSLAAYALEYTIYTNLRPNIVGGDLTIAAPAGESDKVSLRIPALDLVKGEEMFIRFTLGRRGGGEAGTVVLTLPQNGRRTTTVMSPQPVDKSDSTMAAFVPQIYFVGHEGWKAQLVDSISTVRSDGTFSTARMIRYYGNGSAACDLTAITTFFAEGDAVTDFRVKPADGLRERLTPVVRLRRTTDSVEWFGLDREVLFLADNSGLAGTYTHSTMSTVKRDQVRWCAAGASGSRTFVAVLDNQCSMAAAADHLDLTLDNGKDTFRVHVVELQDEESPADIYARTYPRVEDAFMPPPEITASAPRFNKPIEIKLATGIDGGEIRYTTDGTEPTPQSELYKKPFTIGTTTVVKARVYAKGQPPSFTTTRRFNYDHIVRTTFSRKPNTPYNIGADTVLFDGVEGTVGDLARGWLGFSGKAPVIVVELSDTICVEAVKIRFAHSPATWSFAPQGVSVSSSADGQTFADTVSVEIPFDPASAEHGEPRVVELVLPLAGRPTGYLRIEPSTLQAIPEWHRAKGLKPWLMVDEIEVIEK